MGKMQPTLAKMVKKIIEKFLNNEKILIGKFYEMAVKNKKITTRELNLGYISSGILQCTTT